MLSMSLMCHPDRKRFVRALQRKLPEAEVVWDKKSDRWETGRRSLLAFDPAAKWHCVVQDDAVLCKDFAKGVRSVAKAAGADRPVGLYVGKIRPHKATVTPAVRLARETGAHWIEMDGPWWGVAIIIPTAHIPELVRWGDAHPKVRNYDRRISAWYKEQGVKCWYTVPSLVDHRPVDENPSLIPGRSGNRRAHDFLGRTSPLRIDWSKPPVPVQFEVAFKHVRTGRRRVVAVGSPRHSSLARNANWERGAA